MSKDQHKWVKKDCIAAHVYRWVCEGCGTEAFNVDNYDNPSHYCDVTESSYSTYSNKYYDADVKNITNLLSCSECAIKEVIT